ncbi:hypothetical protein BE21_19325 [Sorangium cellulosum]|uniref:Phage-related protein n=1 Tax=Sorangium cellulosum TaxID=56 RepID=A0A150TWT9_SORCE|nr:hypothetical protein BE21_19325 [Sorangium cellulosum]
MPLSATLEGTFNDPSRTTPAQARSDMSAAFTQSPSGSPPRPTDLPAAPSFDTAALGRLVSRFSSIDMSGIDASVGAAGGVSVTIPDTDALLAPVRPLLALIQTARNDDAVRLLRQLRTPPAESIVGLAGVEAGLGQLLGAHRSPAVTSLLGAARGLFPQPVDIDAPLARFGDVALAARDLITLVGSMMAIHTAATDLRDGAAMIDQLLAPETAATLSARARAWTEGEAAIAAVVAVSDPNDPAQVGAAAEVVAEVVRALDDLTSTLTRAMGFGEATLVHTDPMRSAHAIEVAAARLRTVDSSRIRAACEGLAGGVTPILPAGEAPALPLDEAWAAASELSVRAVTAIEGLSAEPLTRPVQQSLGAVTALIHQINAAFGQISGAIRGAFNVVREAIDAIDLAGIAREITRFLQPINAAIAELTAFIDSIKGTITSVANGIISAITAVTGVIEQGAEHVKAAFTAVQTAVQALGIQQLIDSARAGVQRIADELHSIQLQPYFDTASDVMNTGADALSLVPFGLLPDSAKRELDGVVAPIRAIDFRRDVVDVLTHELDAILDRLDTEVLDAISEEFGKVVAVLTELDPRRITDPLDAEFTAFVARVKAVDPEAALRPVFAAVDQIRTEIARIDVRARVITPVDQIFDQILGAIDRVDPAPLLQPVEDQVSAIRQQILDVTHIDQWADRVEDVHRAIDGFLARIDPTGLGDQLDRLLDRALGGPPSRDGSVIGSMIASLVEGLGLHARPRSFVAVLGWITGDDGAAEVRALVASAATALAHAHATVAGVDLRAIAAQLDVGFRRLRAAVEAHDAGSALRLRLDPMLAAAAPLDTLGALGSSQDRYLAALEATARAVETMTAHGLSEITATRTDLQTAFAPLSMLRARAIAVGRGLGLDLAGGDLRAMVDPLLTALRPSRVLTLVGPIIAALRDKIRAILVEGLLTPVRAGIGELSALVANLDISVFRIELTALFTQVKAELGAMRPSVVLGPIIAELEAFRDALAAFDPLDPVKVVIATLRASIEKLETALKPSILMAGLIGTYDDIMAMARGLDVRTLLEPILTALRDLEAQLDTGLGSTAGAFEHLQQVIGSIGGGGGGVQGQGTVSVGDG